MISYQSLLLSTTVLNDSWAEDVSQPLPTITVDLLFSMAQQTIYYIPI